MPANLNVITSNTFQISNASKLVVTSTPVPSTTTLGRVMQIPVKVQFRDADNNNIPLSGINIVASAQGATMSGTTTLQSGALGFVIFTQLTFSGGSQVIVTFSSPGMTSAVLTINLIPTNIIKPRRSIVAGDPPIVGDIVPFEIAINIPDRQLWVADETGTPILIVDGDANTGGGGGASALVDLTDVVITSPTNGQVLKYDTASSKWINTTDATGSGGGGASAIVGLTDVVITSPTNNQVLKYQTSSGKWINGTDATGGGSGSGTDFSTGSTAPASPAQGDRWVSTNDAILYTYYGTAWVQFNT